MGRPLRALTEIEQTEPCDRCDAKPGERCRTGTGRFYSGGVHAERETGRARRKVFSTDGIHPRTLAETSRGKAVVVRDAFGNHLQKIATTSVVPGHDFLVVWVARESEWAAARRACREPQAVPWPAGDVWLPGDEPKAEDAGGDGA